MKPASAFILIAVLGLTGLSYANSLNGAWTFDDMAIRAWLGPGLPEDAEREFGIAHRPLLWLTYWLDAQRGGLDRTFWFHATNLGIHLLAAAAVFGIARQWLAPLAAGFGAAIAGVHPFFSSAVNYIDGRGSMLCALLILSAGYCLTAMRSWRKWPLAALALIAACAVKEEAAAFAALALAYGIVHRLRWLQALALGAMAAGIAGIMFLAPYIPTVFTSDAALPAGSLILNGFDTMTAAEQLQAVANGFVFHILRQIAWPDGLTIDPPMILGWRKALLSAGILAGVASIAAWRKPSIAVRLGAAALLASPMLGSAVIMLADPLFEYRNYICLLGVALLSGSAFELAWKRFPIAAAYVALGILLALALATTQRNELWRSSESLWADAHLKAPGRIRPAQNLAADMMAAGKPKEALAVMESVLKDRPALRGLNANAALAHLQMGHPAEAEQFAKKGVPVPAAWTVLSLAQMAQGKYKDALAAAEKATEANPRSAEAWSAMGQALAANGKNYEAYEALVRASGIVKMARDSAMALAMNSAGQGD